MLIRYADNTGDTHDKIVYYNRMQILLCKLRARYKMYALQHQRNRLHLYNYGIMQELHTAYLT